MSHKAQEDHSPEFRRRAEVQLGKMITKAVPSLAPKHVQALVKELQVHQLELQMQNLELERTRLDAEDSRDRYRDLFESAPVAYCTMDSQGRIQEINGAAETLLAVDRKTIMGHQFAAFVADEHVPRFTLACRAMLKMPGHHGHDISLNIGGVAKTILIDGCAISHTGHDPQLRFTLTDLTARQHVEDGHREHEAQTQIELTDTKLLQSLGAQLIQEGNADVLYETILDAAMTLTHSDMACMQRLDTSQDALRLLVWRGLDPLFGQFFGLVPDGAQTSCSIARRMGHRIIVPDIETCGHLVGTPALELYRRTGIRAVQSTPLVSRTGHLVGMLSTHWRTPHCPSVHDLRLFDVVVRQAADLIDRQQVWGALRDSEARFHRLSDELELRVAERTDELTASEDRLRALASELHLAEHRERTRLTTELHDHLAQMLVYGLLKLGQARKAVGLPQCAALIQEGQEALTTSLDYTRTLIADLSPPVLREFGLAVALQWLGRQMQKYELAVRVDAPESAASSMAEDRAVLLFQSARELLINTAKHGQTDHASMSLQCEHGILQLVVKDEGCGFEVRDVTSTPSVTASSKFGLFSIRERMKVLGGSFEMVSAKGKGTRATLILPLHTNTLTRLAAALPSNQ